MTTQPIIVGEILLTDWRIAFANGVFEATQVLGKGVAAFSASFLAPPDHLDMPNVQQVMLAAAQHKWGAQGAEVFQGLAAGGRICLRDGNSKPAIAGYPGNWFISARSPDQPLVIDQNRQEITRAAGLIYSGCYVNARLNLWAMDNINGRRINAQLAGVQFSKDGERFSGGGAASAEEFGEVEQTVAAGSEFGTEFGIPTAPVAPGVVVQPVAPGVPAVPGAPPVVPGLPPIV